MQTLIWKLAAALVLLACASCGGWVARGWKERSDRLESIQRDFERIVESDRAASKANRELQQALARKPAEAVRTVIRENPSDCRIARPVADSLRDTIRRANQTAE